MRGKAALGAKLWEERTGSRTAEVDGQVKQDIGTEEGAFRLDL